MHSGPEPLPIGTELHKRYSIQHVLGQGGFGITYLVLDNERGDTAVVKEMAPIHTIRNADLTLRWQSLNDKSVHRLRHQFLRESELLRKLRMPGVPIVRDIFQEHGTCYYVVEHLPKTQTVESILVANKRLNEAEVEEFLERVCAILENVHAAGILHRDLKPSNILVGSDGQVYLIDFGSAREWHQSHTNNMTVSFTPGFAPLEQLSERGRRGPATDLYGLCATAYTLLTGEHPPAATDRLSGEELLPLQVNERLARAIESGLSLRFEDRPQTVTDFLDILHSEIGGVQPDVALLDAKLVRLKQFVFEKRGCPVCDDVLVEPKPLANMQCPVCREHRIERRTIYESLCPRCKRGNLREHKDDKEIPTFCPVCRAGLLPHPKSFLGRKKRTVICPSCEAKFVENGDDITLESTGETGNWAGWRARAERSEVSKFCDACDVQFDLVADGRWQQLLPTPSAKDFSCLFADEWAMLANGLEPGSGNANCPGCAAEFFIEGDSITLLQAFNDIHKFAANYEGVRMPIEEMRWVGAGKMSGQAGYVCNKCHIEFDNDPNGLQLAYTSDKTLRSHVGDVFSLENWQRLGADLPIKGDESLLIEALHGAIAHGYETGSIEFNQRNTDILWEGVTECDEKQEKILINHIEIVCGRLLRKSHFPLADIAKLHAEEDVLTLELIDQTELILPLQPQQIEVKLESGKHLVTLSAESLAARLGTELGAPE